MVELLRHQKVDTYFYIRFSDQITIADIDFAFQDFKESENGKKRISIIEFAPGSRIIEVNYHIYSAKKVKEIRHGLEESVIIGLRGVIKTLFKTYLLLAPKDAFKRTTYSDVTELEEARGFKISTDFVSYASFSQ